VRYYHAKGLLPEPERDHSGYRRYDAGAVVELVRIRTLAEAGVPLSCVRELLVAGEEEFAAAVAEIDARLRAEIRERQRHRERHRERIARLAAGDNLTLPKEVVVFLDRLRALGVDERIVRVERDGWIPLAARSPERVPEWMARKLQQLADPQIVDFYVTLSEALDRPDDDPRLVELADKLAAYITQVADEQGEWYVDDTGIESPFAELLDTHVFDTLPVGPSADRAAVGEGLDRLDQAGAREPAKGPCWKAVATAPDCLSPRTPPPPAAPAVP
jgi:DNA-binding transcriptional MerR regulator